MSKLHVFKNPEKKDHEVWKHNSNLCQFPHPFRMTITGEISGGKTSLMKNIVYFNNKKMNGNFKPFKNIYVVHGNENTIEYDDIQPTMIINPEIFPPMEWWCQDHKVKDKNLIIFDDVCTDKLPQHVLKNIKDLYSHVSSHHGYSILFSYQSFFNVEPFIIKQTNVFTFFGANSLRERADLGNRMGLDKDTALKLFDYIEKKHDCITYDKTEDTPAKYRKNLFEAIFV